MVAGGDNVFRYLVRYGAPGFIGRFGTIYSIPAPRGARVVVATDRGIEAGEVLIGHDDPVWANDLRPPMGEVLRRMTEQDLRQAEQLRETHAPLLEEGRRRIVERAIGVSLVDGETLLDGRHVVLYFLGPPTEKLGPLAVELGQKAGALHVQFQSLDVTPEEAADALEGTKGNLGDPSSFPGPVAAAPDEHERKLSHQETIKLDARRRSPEIAQALRDPALTKLSRDDAFLLQLHGVYQQEDRDARKARPATANQQRNVASSARRHFFMVRIKPPGGRLTASQMLTHLELADRYGAGKLRITSRQGLQLHGVAKGDLDSVIREINAALLTTVGACGDVSRNVMCCPAPLRNDRVRARLQAATAEIARHLTPRCPSYYEIWLDDAPWSDVGSEAEPVYGDAYLPRKFKVGLALPDDNCVDVFTQDVGLLAAVEDERLAGFHVLVGGGLGSTIKRDDTFPALAQPLAFVPAGEELRVVDAVVQVHRRNSNRADRRRARLKYLVADWGIEKFREAVEEHFERPLAPMRPLAISGADDHLGWRPQGDGRFFLGVPVLSGRIQDTSQAQLKTALSVVLRRFLPPVRLTPQQNLILCDLAPDQQAPLEDIFRSFGTPLVEQISPLRRHALACPALPTCGLAVAEAERMLPGLLDRLERELERLGLSGETIALRVAGCPSACSRTATAEVALVGHAPGKYAIYFGGGSEGDRLNLLYRDHVPQEHLLQELVAAFTLYRQHRQTGESMGDFFHQRLGAQP